MWRLKEAVRFLTVIPLPYGGAEMPEGARIAEIQRWFPAVGALIGLASAAAAWTLSAAPDRLAAGVAVALGAALTGALHWDGVADSADAFFSGRPRERMLEILKDSRIGTMGALALIVVFFFKVELTALALAQGGFAPLALAPALGRWAVVLGAWRARYARPEGGTGSAFIGAVAPKDVGIATFSAALLAFGLSGLWGAGALLAAAVAVFATIAYANRKIGGATGDVLGAANELAEIAVLCALTLR